ncbi:ABC transporter ATP-binding protein, partial [bacterium]|nr:ABC transporter ATP-binding protein [bacterium]
MLQVSGISFSYGSLVALDDVSLTVEAGEGVALLGPNGAGKSTLMQVVMGALTPSAGEMTLDGERLGAANRRTLGYVPQDIALQKDLTSRENLEILGACAGLWGKELAAAVEEGLALARMQKRADDRIDKLSGGMKRRINLAAGLVHGPTLLLLDEPGAGVNRVLLKKLAEK